MVDSLILASIVLLACATIVGAFRERERVRNLAAAWPHRQAFARALGELESDPETPEYILANLNHLYDRIFDERFLRRIASEGTRSGSRTGNDPHNLKTAFGDWHGRKIHEAVTAYAWVVMYANVRVDLLLRRTTADKDSRTAKARQAETAYLTNSVLAARDDDTSGGGLRPA
jgi:hypothetical protein